jgi:tight adherence protein C
VKKVFKPVLNILAFSTVVLLIIFVDESVFSFRRQVRERLQLVKKMEGLQKDEDLLKKSFWERLLKPACQNLGNTLGNLTPREIRQNIEKKIIYAGNPSNMRFSTFVSLQALLVALLASLSLFLAWTAQIGRAKTFLFLTLAIVMGVMLPVNMINSRARRRQHQIQKTLPDIFDLLLVSVEAGLSFDMSLKRVTEQTSGVLSREISRALEEMRLGKAREEALRAIVLRTGVADLGSFISAVIQSEQLGSNIANTLRIQAVTMRQKRRQRAEESAMKAPIKMLIPLVFFIFPTLFVVLLGPAFLKIVHTFSGMF